MRKIRIVIIVLGLFVLLGAVDYYRIASAEGIVVDVTEPKRGTEGQLRIKMKIEEGKYFVMRNEGARLFPPYMKFDGENIQAAAADHKQTRIQVKARFYGWRSTWFSMFPNILSLKPVEQAAPKAVPAS